MAHEIENTDGLMMNRTAAWHGLGVVVGENKTAAEGLEIGRLRWRVQKARMEALIPTDTEDGLKFDGIDVPKRVALVREDTRKVLGVVGEGYTPVQNEDLAAFCDALVENGDKIIVESCGSIRGGEKVWFLLRAESFSVRDADVITPYILASNGHDGFTSFRITPTTVRVQCSNTLHMVLPREEGGRYASAGAHFVCRHTGSIKGRIEEAKTALGLYGRSMDNTRKEIECLSKLDVKSDDVQRFFLESYTADFGAVPVTITNEKEERARERAMQAYGAVAARFDLERGVAGTTWWNAMNAYTWWLQHDGETELSDKQRERATSSRLWGVTAARTQGAFARAIAMSQAV